MNSPRSKEAIKLLGLEEDMLYYIPFTEYLKNHPELSNLDKDLQQKKYNHVENRRKKYIEDLILKRRAIISDDNEKKNKINETLLNKNSFELELSAKLQKDNQKLKFIKNQQISEIKNRIEYDFKLFDLQRKNEEKYLNQEKNLEEIKKKKQQIQMEKLKKEKLLEIGRQEKIKEEYQAFLKAKKVLMEKEKQLEIEVENRKREKEIENENKKKLNQQKKEHYLLKVKQLYNEELEKRNQAREQLKKKEEIQKKNLEEIRKEKEIETREKIRKTEEKILKARKKDDNYKIIEKIKEYFHKQEIAEEKRKKFSEERIQKIKQQELLRKEKEKDIKEFIKTKELNILKKLEEFNKKQIEIKQRKEEIDTHNKQLLRIKKIKLIEKEQKCLETRLRYDKDKERLKKRIMDKINMSQDRIILIKKRINRESQERSVELSIRKDDIEENLRKKEKLLELNNIKLIKEHEEK